MRRIDLTGQRFGRPIVHFPPPPPTPLPSLTGHRVKLTSTYADMEMGFTELSKAVAQANKWRAEFPASRVTIEIT
jgi:hypothetical protein